MAFLTPDKIITAAVAGGTITIKQKITLDGTRATRDICSYVKKGDLVKPNAKLNDGTGKPKGVAVHNTNDIKCAAGTNPAEQYARATIGGNMNGVAVHFWVWKTEIWQQLSENERGWHAADGSSRRASQRTGEKIGGNLDTISIECIGTDAQSEDTTAKLVAYLLKKHGLSAATDVYTHNYFMGLPNKIVSGAKKNCPLYILPHWPSFMDKVKGYFAVENKPTPPEQGKPEDAGKLYRVQIGAFSVKSNAEALLKKAKEAGFTDAYIKQE